MVKLGNYTLHSIETGRFRLDGGAMFGIVPKALWARKITPDDQNRIPLAMRCLLAIGNGRVILIDNGIGNKYDEKFAGHFAIDTSRDNLHHSLEQAGVSAADVTDVVLTHLHFDHCGGSTRRTGDRLELTFPNARYHVQRKHWDWAEAANERERASFLKENLEPLGSSGHLMLLDGPGELFPDIDVLLINGHTRGQQMVRFRSANRTLVFVADLLPTHHHVRLPWIMAYDIAPLDTLSEKKAFLQEACVEKWTLIYEHDPETAISELVSTDRGIAVTGARSFDQF